MHCSIYENPSVIGSPLKMSAFIFISAAGFHDRGIMFIVCAVKRSEPAGHYISFFRFVLFMPDNLGKITENGRVTW